MLKMQWRALSRPGRRLIHNVASITNGKLQMPGFNMPLNSLPDPNDLDGYDGELLGFPNALDPTHTENMYDIVTHREILMMRVMNNITDKIDWDKKVFDKHITSKWRNEITESGQDVTPKMMDWIIKELQWKAEEESLGEAASERGFTIHDRDRIQPKFSRKFQWLPCDVDIKNSRCEILCYINNVHPVQHRGLYDVIEKVIARTIPLWDKSLSKKSSHQRISYGEVEYDDSVEPEPIYPQDPDENFDEDEYFDQHEKWESSRPIRLPEPTEFEICEHENSNTINLSGQFGHEGLQVIVKLANIELTPEKPDYGGGTWHIEGQLNERICATAIYYYDNHNITESSLSFRQRGADLDDMKYEQDRHEFLQDVYGLANNGYWNGTEITQEVGGVVCQEGRLLTFPNSVQHKVSPFSLADRSRSGHRKILALFLIDPYRRVISSANVPPQREDWAPTNLKDVNSVHSRTSTNSPDTPGQDISSSMISMKEAEAYRLELMEERSVRAVEHNNVFEDGSFHLCEH